MIAQITPESLGGSGTLSDPYEIASCDDLQDMSNDVTAHYELINDIDCSDTATWNLDGFAGFYGFDPVGELSASFTGGPVFIKSTDYSRKSC